jgi:hypothetical protein
MDILVSDKRIGGAVPEGRDLGFEEPSEVGFEKAELLFAQLDELELGHFGLFTF